MSLGSQVYLKDWLGLDWSGCFELADEIIIKTKSMTIYNWYADLIKPSWAPPTFLFGQVWSILYLLIFLSFGMVFYQAIVGKIPWLVTLPFVANLVFNLAFGPLQFGLRNNLLASIDIVLLWLTLVWALATIWRYMPWVSLINLPYLAWVSFATVLQITITYLNR